MSSEVIELSTSDCELLLASLDIGRVAIVDNGYPLVFPINYKMALFRGKSLINDGQVRLAHDRVRTDDHDRHSLGEDLGREKHPLQLFVAASHVRTGLTRLLHPTTAGQIIRLLAAPVLVVPHCARPRRHAPTSVIAAGGHRSQVATCTAWRQGSSELTTSTRPSPCSATHARRRRSFNGRMLN